MVFTAAVNVLNDHYANFYLCDMIKAICSSTLFLHLVEPAVCQMALSGLIVMTIADNRAHVLHAARLCNSNSIILPLFFYTYYLGPMI